MSPNVGPLPRTLSQLVLSLAAAAIAVLALATPAGAGEVARPAAGGPGASASIIGGYYPHPSQWPWMAALLDRGSSANDYHRQFCGSVLVHPRLVVTAAHCVVDDGVVTPASRLEVVLGKRRLSSAGGEHIGVTRVSPHPHYDGSNLSYDVALLFLERPSAMTPATLLEPNVTLYQGNLATVMGWGRVAMDGSSYNSSHSDDLKALDQVIWSDSTCRAAGQTNDDAYFYSGIYHPATMICAGDSASYDASCKGDSGSPMMVKNTTGAWRLVGVVSWGGLQCSGGWSPTVYAWLHGPTLRAFVADGIRKAAEIDSGNRPCPGCGTPCTSCDQPCQGCDDGGRDPEPVKPRVQITHAKLSRVRVRRGQALGLRFRANAAGEATIAVRRARRPVGRWLTDIRPGRNSVKLPTRKRGRKLPQGIYRISVTLTDENGDSSNTVQLGFRIR